MKVLVAIKTCWKYRQRREAQRLTWLPQLADWATDHQYFAGRPAMTPTQSIQSAVGDEKYVYPVMKCDDTFGCIGPKVKAACWWAMTKNYDLTVILDDDTYVVPERLIEMCRVHFDEGRDVTAYFRTDPIHYPHGSAYILSRRATGILAVSDALLEKGPDDIIVGQVLLASRQLLKVHHTNQLHPGPQVITPPLKNNDIVTAHKCLPHDMIAAHFDWLKSHG